MPLPPAFRVTETDGTLRIAWSNRDVPKDGCVTVFLLVFWLVLTCFTLYGTWWVCDYLFASPFDLGWYCVLSPCGTLVGFLAWYGVLVTPRALMRRRWGEEIAISAAAITHTRTGWLSPRPRAYPLDRVNEFALGWHRNGPSGTSNHVWHVGLYVDSKDAWGGREPHPVAEWLSPELCARVFEVVRGFVADRGVALTTTEWGEGPTARMARLRNESRPTVTLPPEFKVTEADGTLRIEWDNRRVAQHIPRRVLDVGAVLFGLGAVLWTYLLVAGLFEPREQRDSEMLLASAFNFPFWWFFALFPAYLRLARTWVECVEVGRDAVTVTRTGWLAPKPVVYPLAKIERLALAWRGAHEGDTDGSESISLLIYSPGKYGPSFTHLAGSLSDPLKHQLFETIREFAIRNDIPLAFDEWGTRPEWAKPSATPE
jgi:hypothetical protein